MPDAVIAKMFGQKTGNPELDDPEKAAERGLKVAKHTGKKGSDPVVAGIFDKMDFEDKHIEDGLVSKVILWVAKTFEQWVQNPPRGVQSRDPEVVLRAVAQKAAEVFPELAKAQWGSPEDIISEYKSEYGWFNTRGEKEMKKKKKVEDAAGRFEIHNVEGVNTFDIQAIYWNDELSGFVYYQNIMVVDDPDLVAYLEKKGGRYTVEGDWLLDPKRSKPAKMYFSAVGSKEKDVKKKSIKDAWRPEPGDSVSHGTLRSQDLIVAFAEALDQINRSVFRKVLKLWQDVPFLGDADDVEVWADANPEDASELITELEDALNEVAPPGTYFGAHPGDGSDFGFWSEEMMGSKDQDGKVIQGRTKKIQEMIKEQSQGTKQDDLYKGYQIIWHREDRSMTFIYVSDYKSGKELWYASGDSALGLVRDGSIEWKDNAKLIDYLKSIDFHYTEFPKEPFDSRKRDKDDQQKGSNERLQEAIIKAVEKQDRIGSYDGYEIDWYQERDRASIVVTRRGKDVWEAWDETVYELIEDGFIKWEDDAMLIEYLRDMGIADSKILKEKKVQDASRNMGDLAREFSGIARMITLSINPLVKVPSSFYREMDKTIVEIRSNLKHLMQYGEEAGFGKPPFDSKDQEGKKVEDKGATSATAKCPKCGGKYLVATGFCAHCKKKVATGHPSGASKKKESQETEEEHVSDLGEFFKNLQVDVVGKAEERIQDEEDSEDAVDILMYHRASEIFNTTGSDFNTFFEAIKKDFPDVTDGQANKLFDEFEELVKAYEEALGE